MFAIISSIKALYLTFVELHSSPGDTDEKNSVRFEKQKQKQLQKRYKKMITNVCLIPHVVKCFMSQNKI